VAAGDGADDDVEEDVDEEVECNVNLSTLPRASDDDGWWTAGRCLLSVSDTDLSAEESDGDD
jgi:hypothetical protein